MEFMHWIDFAGVLRYAGKIWLQMLCTCLCVCVGVEMEWSGWENV
jgi:hypothetical protein